MSNILVTRPQESSLELISKLKELDHKTISYPLFSIKKNYPVETLKDPESLVITSSNAISFFLNLKLSSNILLFVVGDKTKKKIMQYGYENIVSAPNARNLLEKIEKQSSKKGSIIYLSGNIVTIDLANHLINKGFNARRIIAYETLPKKSLSPIIINQLRNNQIDFVTIYSKNTAEILQKLLKKHNLLAIEKEIKLLCLSTEICKFCKKLGFNKADLIQNLWKTKKRKFN